MYLLRPSSLFVMPLICLVASGPVSAVAGGDALKGKEAYGQRCGACHSIEFNGVGPKHGGVLGRKAGSVPDFPYSAALKASAVTWSDETLEKWLTDPEKFIPGQRMWISVPDPVERQNIIAYLRTETRK